LIFIDNALMMRILGIL